MKNHDAANMHGRIWPEYGHKTGHICPDGLTSIFCNVLLYNVLPNSSHTKHPMGRSLTCKRSAVQACHGVVIGACDNAKPGFYNCCELRPGKPMKNYTYEPLAKPREWSNFRQISYAFRYRMLPSSSRSSSRSSSVSLYSSS